MLGLRNRSSPLNPFAACCLPLQGEGIRANIKAEVSPGTVYLELLPERDVLDKPDLDLVFVGVVWRALGSDEDTFLGF